MDGAAILGALISPEGREDPYPTYAAAHDVGDLVDIGGNMWLAVGYDAVNKILRSRDFVPFDERFDRPFMDDWRAHPSYVALAQSVLASSPPDHTRMRKVMSAAFSARRIAMLESDLGKLADQLVGELAEAGAGGATVDFMKDFAFRLSVGVICGLFGIPQEHWAQFRRLGSDWSEVTEVMIDPDGLVRADEAYHEFKAYCDELVRQRRREPGQDLVSAVIEASQEPESSLSPEELLANLAVLLIAGYETTTNLLGNAMMQLLKDPELDRRVRSGEVPLGGFIEEVLRFDGSVQIAGRVTRTETEVSGVRLTPGAWVIALLGAANRDPRRVADPDRFDPLRESIQPLSFGAGIHHCIGAPLARLESAIAFRALLDRFSHIAPAGTPVRRHRMVIRGYQSLPVTVTLA